MKNNSYIDRVVNRHPFGWRYTDPQTVYHFTFEEVDPFWWVDFATRNQVLALYAGAFYVLSIFGLKHLMKTRKPFQLKTPMFLWNMALGLFSIIGFSRIFPGFWKTLQQPGGFYTSICLREYGDIPTGFWCLMFVLSKFVELGDTLFLVLKKKPVVFLQWYHHLVTMAVCWIVAPFMEPIARWATVLNYGVHSLMYPYFALMVTYFRTTN